MKKGYLNCKRIETAISRAKNILIKKAERRGLYENFGQDEVKEIEDHFIDYSSYTDEMNRNRKKLQLFNEWALNYNL